MRVAASLLRFVGMVDLVPPELLVLADAITVLRDDNVLELFKKTLPSGASSFLQTQVTGKDEFSQDGLDGLRALLIADVMVYKKDTIRPKSFMLRSRSLVLPMTSRSVWMRSTSRCT